MTSVVLLVRKSLDFLRIKANLLAKLVLQRSSIPRTSLKLIMSPVNIDVYIYSYIACPTVYIYKYKKNAVRADAEV